MYLLQMEAEGREEELAARFRDDFFLHSIASQNPTLYRELYAEVDAPEDFEVPETEDDLRAMAAELAQVGVHLNLGTDF